jgi:cytochrome c biogenesis protein CcmG, thiol:disulfide interchange protein DsbE
VNPGHLRKIIIVGFAAVALVAGFYILNHHGVSPSLRITSAEHPFAPEFSLPDMSGQQVRLSDYRGKVILLDFWATWCEPCRGEIPHFVELQNMLGDQGFQVIGVSMDDGPEPVRDFYRQLKMNYPVVMGNAKIGELYGGVLGLPIAFVIGRDGRIYSRHIGATDISLFEREIEAQLQAQETSPPNQ